MLDNHLGKVTFVLGIVAIILCAVPLGYYVAYFGTSITQNHEKWAQFGDFIGGTVGTVFAFLALLGLLFTLRLQSKELKNSSTELRNSALALKEQSDSISVQNFENRFFSMVSLHHEIVKSMDLRKEANVTATGRDCLRVFYERLKTDLEKSQRGDELDYRIGLMLGYEDFYTKHNHELGHYFRFIYRIIKFVDDSNISDKTEYTGVLRAQLSNPELALLFYNSISARGAKFQKLAEKYALFENLELSVLVDMKRDTLLVSREAFGEQAINSDDLYA